MKTTRAVLLVLVALLGLPGHLPAQTEPANSIQQAILGTWKLVSYVREEIPSGAKSDVMGAHPSGYINYGRDGRRALQTVPLPPRIGKAGAFLR
jgi:lipocalin-like protein